VGPLEKELDRLGLNAGIELQQRGDGYSITAYQGNIIYVSMYLSPIGPLVEQLASKQQLTFSDFVKLVRAFLPGYY
jgi:hypothetical protein